MTIKDNYYNLRDNLNLTETEDKKGLIELLLIVGSLVVAFNTTEDLTGNHVVMNGSIITLFFMFFALSSICYFIFIQSEYIKVEKKIIDINWIAYAVAIFFSAIMAIILAMSTIKFIEKPLMESGFFLLVFFAYWLLFTFLISAALRIKNP